MPKIKELGSDTGIYWFDCPGCKCSHAVYTKFKNSVGAQWTFNGNVDKPTFNPSLLVYSTDAKGNKNTSCHSFVRDGNIQFLTDCKHSLAGQTVPLSEIEN